MAAPSYVYRGSSGILSMEHSLQVTVAGLGRLDLPEPEKNVNGGIRSRISSVIFPEQPRVLASDPPSSQDRDKDNDNDDED